MMRWFQLAALAAFGILAVPAVAAKPAGAAKAADATPGPKPVKPLFAGNELVHLTIRAPVMALTKSDAKAGKVVQGTISVAGGAQAIPVALSARGVKRRQHDVCAFPPLRLEFAEKPPQGSLFQGQKKLKLVTHCQRVESFEQYVLLEYAAYRMYNVLTPQSFNARLAQIDYVDENGKPIISRLGFFIEDGDDMARRQGLQELEIAGNLSVPQISPKEATRFALFQNFIGNLDWAMNAGPAGTNCCHNARPIGVEGATKGLIPVPYDFDYAGLVSAPYAAAPAMFRYKNVRVRRFRGFCAHNGEVEAMLERFIAAKPQLLGVLDQIPQLDEGDRNRARSYLEDFFKQGDGAKDMTAKLVLTCI